MMPRVERRGAVVDCGDCHGRCYVSPGAGCARVRCHSCDGRGFLLIVEGRGVVKARVVRFVQGTLALVVAASLLMLPGCAAPQTPCVCWYQADPRVAVLEDEVQRLRDRAVFWREVDELGDAAAAAAAAAKAEGEVDHAR
jgi:hypothetical protein